MNLRRFAAILACITALVAVDSSSGAQTLPTIKVTTLSIDAGAEVYYAKDMGFFSKAGIDVEIFPAANGGATTAAVAGGGADIGYTDLVSLSAAHSRGVPFTIIAPAALYEASAPTTALVVAANSPIRSAKDLNGKVLAGSGLGTISGYGPRAWIDANGGDASTVKFVELAFPAMKPALDAGRIDAATIAEPFLSAARKTDRILANPYDAVAKEFYISVYFTTSPWAKEHPELVERFTAAMREAAVWANKNHDKSEEILLKYAKIDPLLVAGATRIRYGERLQASLVQPVIALAAKYQKFAPFPAEDLIYKPAR